MLQLCTTYVYIHIHIHLHVYILYVNARDVLHDAEHSMLCACVCIGLLHRKWVMIKADIVKTGEESTNGSCSHIMVVLKMNFVVNSHTNIQLRILLQCPLHCQYTHTATVQVTVTYAQIPKRKREKHRAKMLLQHTVAPIRDGAKFIEKNPETLKISIS